MPTMIVKMLPGKKSKMSSTAMPESHPPITKAAAKASTPMLTGVIVPIAKSATSAAMDMK